MKINGEEIHYQTRKRYLLDKDVFNMSNKYVLMITALIIFIVILSEIHSNKTKQQLQNDLQKAEERLENSKNLIWK